MNSSSAVTLSALITTVADTLAAVGDRIVAATPGPLTPDLSDALELLQVAGRTLGELGALVDGIDSDNDGDNDGDGGIGTVPQRNARPRSTSASAPASHRRGELVDVRERRGGERVEVRSQGNELTLTGYASTWLPYSMYGGPAEGGWIEQLDRNAFDKSLAGNPDLHLLINHEGLPLARTKSGTLQLSTDHHGLKVTAQLDRSDPDVQRLESKMRRGDMDEMSFAFRTKAQHWSAAPGFDDDEYSHRLITEASLHKGDVSVVNFGANPTTSAELLGARRKVNGVQKTMSLSEAMSVVATGAVTRKIRTTRAGKRSRSGTLSLADAQAIAYSGHVDSGAVQARAERIIDHVGHAVPGREPGASGAWGPDPALGVIAVFPSGGQAGEIGAAHAERARVAAQLAELRRIRAEALHPTRTGWPHGVSYASRLAR